MRIAKRIINYDGRHRKMEKIIKKLNVCNKCKIAKPADLANISGEYKLEVSDWEWLCRKCHMDSDGRNDTLRKYGKDSRIHPDKYCKNCDTPLGRKGTSIVRRTYCGKKCQSKYTIENGIYRSGTNKKCEICKKEFYTKPYQLKSRRFCSVKCKSMWMSQLFAERRMYA